MNETLITLAGRLGTNPRIYNVEGGPLVRFRMATTPRRFNRRTGEWYDGATQWHTVTAWRTLADNCMRSLRQGEPVVVSGRLNASSYVNKDGEEVTSWEVEATHVGHDLNRGLSTFYRLVAPTAAPVEDPARQSSDGEGADAEDLPPWAAAGGDDDRDGDGGDASETETPRAETAA